MLRKPLTFIALAVLATASCLWAAAPAQAAPHGHGGFHGGFHGGWHGGYRGGWHGYRGWGGYPGWHGYRGWYGGYYPWYGSYYSAYPWWGYGVNVYPSTTYYVPYYPTTSTVVVEPPVAAAPAAPASTASVELKVPPNAEVWFNGTKMNKSGRVRDFVTPPLKPEQDYAYDVRVRWRDSDGQMVEKDRHILVHAGASLNVDFTQTS